MSDEKQNGAPQQEQNPCVMPDGTLVMTVKFNPNTQAFELQHPSLMAAIALVEMARCFLEGTMRAGFALSQPNIALPGRGVPDLLKRFRS